jgi:ketosteroid isomerase-like protein
MPNTIEVGNKLVAFCRANQNLQAVDGLYATNIVSIEAQEFPGMPRRTEGLQAVRARNEHWVNNNDVHSATVEGPFPHDDRFIVYFEYDFTTKSGPMAGKRTKMKEAGLYTVKDGKIAREEFFYQMG